MPADDEPTPAEAAPPEAAIPATPAVGEVPEVVDLALASVELSPEGLKPETGTVSLVDIEGGGQLDIVMARADAVFVQAALASEVPPRPRTHDLMVAAIEALDGSVTSATLVERRPGGVYVASLTVRRADGSTVELDARPSDALNVALRCVGATLQAVRSLVDVPAN